MVRRVVLDGALAEVCSWNAPSWCSRSWYAAVHCARRQGAGGQWVDFGGNVFVSVCVSVLPVYVFVSLVAVCCTSDSSGFGRSSSEHLSSADTTFRIRQGEVSRCLETGHDGKTYLASDYGVMESDGLPLNISFGSLQQDTVLHVIRQNLAHDFVDISRNCREVQELLRQVCRCLTFLPHRRPRC